MTERVFKIGDKVLWKITGKVYNVVANNTVRAVGRGSFSEGFLNSLADKSQYTIVEGEEMRTVLRLIHASNGKCISLLSWQEKTYKMPSHSRFNDGIAGKSFESHVIDFRCVKLPDELFKEKK